MTAVTFERPASMPLRVCHLITDLDTGGAERSLVNLVTAMDRAQFSCDVVTLIEPGPMAQPLREAGIPVTSLGMRRGRPALAPVIALARHLRTTKAAVLQTWLYHADLIGTAAAWIARPEFLLWNIRCTDLTHAEAEKSIRWLVRLLAMLSDRPDAIIVNSQRGQNDHNMIGYHPKRWVNITNGVDLDRFHPRRGDQAELRTRLGLRPNSKTIGLVARYHPMKDVETFLRAASLFLRDHADTQFVLCGDGFAADNGVLKDAIATLQLERHVILLGRRPDMANVYPALDILTLCSIYGEGFPNVLAEAMACGVPCVTTDIGDSAEIVGDCGVIVPMRDPEALGRGWRTHPFAYGDALRSRPDARAISVALSVFGGERPDQAQRSRQDSSMSTFQSRYCQLRSPSMCSCQYRLTIA
jgi:glycosyltransferase involved in cell wall biosynthesis